MFIPKRSIINTYSPILRTALDELALDPPHFPLKFAVSTFLRYGLYDQNIFTHPEFRSRFAGLPPVGEQGLPCKLE